MPRRSRNEQPGATHHAIAKGNAGERIVRDDHDRQIFVARMGRVIVRYGWSCLAYCLLDTHLHLLVMTPEPNLGPGMKELLGPYAQNFNLRHGREGSLFRGRFYSTPVESDDHLVAALVYVLLNPVRAGLVAEASEWPWSSAAATMGRRAPPGYLAVEAALELFGPDTAAARASLSASLGPSSGTWSRT